MYLKIKVRLLAASSVLFFLFFLHYFRETLSSTVRLSLLDSVVDFVDFPVHNSVRSELIEHADAIALLRQILEFCIQLPKLVRVGPAEKNLNKLADPRREALQHQNEH